VTIATFGIAADDVRLDHFAHWGAFSTTTKPTLARVTNRITEEGGELAGKLALQSIAVTSITALATPYAYAWCQKTLKLMVAVWVAKVATSSNPELAKTLQDELDARFELLDKHGETVLVDVSSSDTGSPPEGPTTHITEFGLTTDDSTDMSTTVPRLRRDDQL
jgi:hypothetical protein